MFWAQVFPFVALQFFESKGGDMKSNITIFLVGSFTLWLAVNIVFFCTIDLSFLGTLFGTKMAP